LFVFYRKFDVNFFVNNFIEKSDYNVYLLYFLIVDNDNNEENFVAYRLYYDDKSLIIIKIFLLFKVANCLSNLVLYYLIIDFSLKLINLFALEDVFVFRYYYNNLNIVLSIRLYFIVLS